MVSYSDSLGTIMAVVGSPENLAVYSKQRGGANGGGSYPTLRLLALVSCGTRTVIDAVFRPVSDVLLLARVPVRQPQPQDASDELRPRQVPQALGRACLKV